MNSTMVLVGVLGVVCCLLVVAIIATVSLYEGIFLAMKLQHARTTKNYDQRIKALRAENANMKALYNIEGARKVENDLGKTDVGKLQEHVLD